MPSRPKPFVPVPGHTPIKTCPCVHHNPVTCMAARHQTSMQLANILGGCACRCHFTATGAQVAYSVWHPIVLVPVARAYRQPGPDEVKE